MMVYEILYIIRWFLPRTLFPRTRSALIICLAAHNNIRIQIRSPKQMIKFKFMPNFVKLQFICHFLSPGLIIQSLVPLITLAPLPNLTRTRFKRIWRRLGSHTSIEIYRMSTFLNSTGRAVLDLKVQGWTTFFDLFGALFFNVNFLAGSSSNRKRRPYIFHFLLNIH